MECTNLSIALVLFFIDAIELCQRAAYVTGMQCHL